MTVDVIYYSHAAFCGKRPLKPVSGYKQVKNCELSETVKTNGGDEEIQIYNPCPIPTLISCLSAEKILF